MLLLFEVVVLFEDVLLLLLLDWYRWVNAGLLSIRNWIRSDDIGDYINYDDDYKRV